MSAKEKISHACAVLLIVSSIALAFLQVLDIDDVATGTLMYIAQAFLLAGYPLFLPQRKRFHG